MSEAILAHLLDTTVHPDDPVAELTSKLMEDVSMENAGARGFKRLLEEALSAAFEARRALHAAEKKIALLEHQALTDPVTGLLNRRGFEQALQTAMARMQRFGEKGVFVVVDLDKFKSINDTMGHQAGDRVLETVGAILTRHTRDTDVVARIGGDEFALILPEADAVGAKRRVKILDRMMNVTTVPWRGTEIPLRASFGTVPYGNGETPTELFSRADRAMYDNKKTRDESLPALSYAR